MGLFINTNLAAINTQRQMLHSQNRLAKSYQRLSSGLRINNAGDDAAGLAISERFTSQIRGLSQAVRNANDGVSLAQVAEGALAESTNILQRMRELSIQAANDINSTGDRLHLQNEVEQLNQELTRIGENTTFNGQPLLDGSFIDAFFHVGAFARETVRVRIRDARSETIGRQATFTGSPVSTNGIGALGDVLLNGITVRTTQGPDDTVSTAFPVGSAIAKAAAINDSTEFHGVRAKPLPTEVIGGARILGGILDNANTLIINGAVISGFTIAPDDAGDNLTRTINEQFEQTGVVATRDPRGRIRLVAEDGRNIEVTTTGAAAGIVGIASQVGRAELNLFSDNQYTVSGANEAFIGFANNQLVGVTTDDSVITVDITSRFTYDL